MCVHLEINESHPEQSYVKNNNGPSFDLITKNPHIIYFFLERAFIDSFKSSIVSILNNFFLISKKPDFKGNIFFNPIIDFLEKKYAIPFLI